MNEMVKRVAKAIEEIDDTTVWASGPYPYETLAVAAVKAMREPTENMELAGWDAGGEWWEDSCPRVVWWGMIDAALAGR
jgi:hypothetical protein